MEVAVTNGLEVTVESYFLPEHSDLEGGHYVFAYRVTLENLGDRTLKLLSRHWIITDGDGNVREVRGEGVVGEQPVLKPGDRHQYVSGSNLSTPIGTMHGTYLMQEDGGGEFNAEIPCFTLAVPGVMN